MYNQSMFCTNMGVMRFVGYVMHEQDLLRFNKVNALRWKFPTCFREKEHIQIVVDGYEDRQKRSCQCL